MPRESGEGYYTRQHFALPSVGFHFREGVRLDRFRGGLSPPLRELLLVVASMPSALVRASLAKNCDQPAENLKGTNHTVILE